MRIIAGNARGARIDTLDGLDTRPTLERVKEGMFSAVQFWLPGANVLDIFAGSGQLGLEALSRGAKSCTFVDCAQPAVKVITKNVQRLNLGAQSQVFCTSAEAFLARCNDKFDLIIADPPYAANTLPQLLVKLSAICAKNAVVLCESENNLQLPTVCENLSLEKTYRYGKILLWRYKAI